jgi:hypothetical protein
VATGRTLHLYTSSLSKVGEVMPLKRISHEKATIATRMYLQWSSARLDRLRVRHAYVLKPAMATKQLYSIWLVPDEESSAYDRLKQEISYWATTVPGPEFVPHVTLVGGIDSSEAEVLKRTEYLAQQLRVPYPCVCTIYENVSVGSICVAARV